MTAQEAISQFLVAPLYRARTYVDNAKPICNSPEGNGGARVSSRERNRVRGEGVLGCRCLAEREFSCCRRLSNDG